MCINARLLAIVQRQPYKRQFVQRKHEAQHPSSKGSTGNSTFIGRAERGEVRIQIEPGHLRKLIGSGKSVCRATTNRVDRACFNNNVV
jgi:hypothetical protein